MLEQIPCPYCDSSHTSYHFKRHLNTQHAAEFVGGVVPDHFLDAYLKRGLYSDALQRGVDFVECGDCGFRAKRMLDHLKKVHRYTAETYLAKYPGSCFTIPGVLEKRVATVQAHSAVYCVLDVPEMKQKITQFL